MQDLGACYYKDKKGMSPTKSTVLALLVTTLAPLAAEATLIDFTLMPDGPVSTIGDATFSLAGAGEQGNPYVDNTTYGSSAVGGLWNSSGNAVYPTNTILRVDFASVVSLLTFDFTPHGLNGSSAQGWSVYDSANALIASGAFTGTNGTAFATYDLSAYSGIRRLELNNGQDNWLQALQRISYTAVSVPEPGTLALLGLGLLGMGATRRLRKN